MRSMNRVQLLGNTTRDPDLKYTQNNTALCRMGVALNRSYRDKDTGEWVDADPTFVDVVFWGKLAERAAQIQKGERVYIEGRLETSSWTDDKGNKRSKMEVTGTGFFPATYQRTQSGDEVAEEHPDAPEEDEPKEKSTKKAEGDEEINPDDIPF